MKDELQDRIDKIKDEIEKLKQTQQHLEQIISNIKMPEIGSEGEVNIPNTIKGGPVNEELL